MDELEYNVEIEGVSYIGAPISHTVMFLTKKVEELLDNLSKVSSCLVFVENGVVVADDIRSRHCIVFSDRPQYEYARYVTRLHELKFEKDRQRSYSLTSEGYYIGENVSIGEGAYIEPGCIIGHDVIIGKNVRIYSGVRIKYATIGDECIINENAIIGASGFTMTEDEEGNMYRIPSMGKVVIGNHVEIGAGNNVSRGSGGNTVIENYVKTDALVHVAHDVHLHENVKITSGVVLGGYVNIEKKSFLGLGVVVKNRLDIEEGVTIGMGAMVTKNLPAGVKALGSPARMIKD